MARNPTKRAVLSQPLPFEFGCSTDVFPADELRALYQDGGRLEALASGKVRPATPADERFLLVDRDEAAPTTLLERAWVRLKGRREYEREQNAHAPASDPEDYGMVEWDEDRCWW